MSPTRFFRRSLLAACLGALPITGAMAQQKVLRVVPQSDVTVLDPMFGSAWISMIHSEMIYESLFAWDTNLQPKPQMAESWSVSPDGLTWRITLRDGLRFHDGSPVTSADVVASTRRWMDLDLVGARVGAVTAALVVVDPMTVEFRLKRPYPDLLGSLAAAPARFAAVMRAKDIEGGAPRIDNAIGSGPFRFVHAERVAGHLTVYAKNTDYIPRSEKPDGLSGGRVVKVDRVEWRVIPDAATASAALQAGEVDILERASLDQIEQLSRRKDIQVRKLTPLAGQNMLRGNATLPPFNDKRAREALNYIIDQGDEMAAGWGDEANWRRCRAYFVCGGPYGTEAGAEGLKQDFARARQLMQEAGYKGEKLVFVSTHEITALGQMAEVAYDALKRAGLNVEMVWTDWGTVGQRLNKRDSWNLFLTGAPGAITFDPLTNVGTNMSCGGRNFVGWPCDPEVETLRAAFMDADPTARPAALDRLHRALVTSAPYTVLGQYDSLTAQRTNIVGLLDSPAIVYWNIEKK
jgi:peptide/nickel transport system substrate-binding protein